MKTHTNGVGFRVQPFIRNSLQLLHIGIGLLSAQFVAGVNLFQKLEDTPKLRCGWAIWGRATQF